MKQKFYFFVAATLIGLFITGCGNKEQKVIGIVKDGVFTYGGTSYSENTIGNMAKNLFIEPKYKAFQDVNEDWYVNIYGIVNWESLEKDFIKAAYDYILFDFLAELYPETEIYVDVDKTFIEPGLLPVMSAIFKDKEIFIQFKVNPKIEVCELTATSCECSDMDNVDFIFGMLTKDYKSVLENLMLGVYPPEEWFYTE